ncbi:nitrilase-related carbon-nitrogen hydrolase [Alkalitalea saponilacus]|uniref:Predicted amidohydrolase n=1 Tax=Alkalitalea saponilacus TaxID=889453 RepID=A0A1T5HF00_9BACT|nr:nitrilase-related carbon-nitrogen hydrolase [Alkalitalea saponilacus]SKC19277.1 Predicted amidohydrolase [Alkalitalea saponilacus]
MRVGLLQYAPVIGDIDKNIRIIEKSLEKSDSADLWVLPELASSGYAFASREEAVLLSEKLSDSKFVRFLMSQAQKHRCWFVSGINEREGDKLYNSSVLVNEEGVLGVYRKLHLFKNEKNIFEPGNLGLPVFETPLGKIAMLICFDWMFPEVWRIMGLKGVQLVCHPSNLVLPWCQTAIPGYALTNRFYVATTNRVGTERGLKFTGCSVLVSPTGEYLLQGKRKKEQSLVADVDLKKSTDKQITEENHAFEDRRIDVYEVNQ